MKQATITTTVVPTTSFLPGQLTFFISTQTSRKKSRVAGHHSRIGFMVYRFPFPVSRPIGRGGGIRTPNLRFWRPPLYQLELHPSGSSDFAFLVRRVLPAEAAVLGALELLRVRLLVLRGRVV